MVSRHREPLLLGALAQPAPAQAQTTGICDRTQQVQDENLEELTGVSDCAAVTAANLATVTQLSRDGVLHVLQAGPAAAVEAHAAMAAVGRRGRPALLAQIQIGHGNN